MGKWSAIHNLMTNQILKNPRNNKNFTNQNQTKTTAPPPKKKKEKKKKEKKKDNDKNE